MKPTILYLLLSLGLVPYYAHSQSWKTYPYDPAGSQISFPKDEGRHTATSIEWWYISGHLTGATTGKEYSFMLTYFHYPKFGFDGFRILNISDDNAQILYSDTKTVNYDVMSTDSLHIVADVFNGGTETWVNKTDNNGKKIPFEYEIEANSSTHGFNLSIISTKRPLILGGDGFFDQGATSSTYYYSQTGNTVSGDLTLNGTTENVTGTAWIDRQYGSFNPYEDEKYEWFHLQLSNGMDINLWNIFTENNTIPDDDKYRLISVYVDDNTQYTNKDFQLERLGYACLNSGNCYAQKWKLTSTVNKLDLTITTLYLEAELTFPFDFYEGTTYITGTVNGQNVTGKGFAELLQHYTDPDISISYPDGNGYNTENPITWDLNDPNEGRPITYELLYSTDNKNTYTAIASGLTETEYVWQNPSVNNGDNIWFKIMGKSIDGTLSGTVESSSASAVTLSVNDIFSEENLLVYPNPATDKLHIELGNITNNFNYIVYDQQGRALRTKNEINTRSTDIPLTDFSPGLYFLRLQTFKTSKSLPFLKK